MDPLWSSDRVQRVPKLPHYLVSLEPTEIDGGTGLHEDVTRVRVDQVVGLLVGALDARMALESPFALCENVAKIQFQLSAVEVFVSPLKGATKLRLFRFRLMLKRQE